MSLLPDYAKPKKIKDAPENRDYNENLRKVSKDRHSSVNPATKQAHLSEEYFYRSIKDIKHALRQLQDTVFNELDTLEEAIDKHNKLTNHRISALEDKCTQIEANNKRIAALEKHYYHENPVYSVHPEISKSLNDERFNSIEADIAAMRVDLVECSSAEQSKKIFHEIDQVKKMIKTPEKPQNDEKYKTLASSIDTIADKIAKMSTNLRELETKSSFSEENSEKITSILDEMASKINQIDSKFITEIDKIKVELRENYENTSIRLEILSKD